MLYPLDFPTLLEQVLLEQELVVMAKEKQVGRKERDELDDLVNLLLGEVEEVFLEREQDYGEGAEGFAEREQVVRKVLVAVKHEEEERKGSSHKKYFHNFKSKNFKIH